MGRLGCDFTKPRTIDSYLYFSVRGDAELAGAELRAKGFHVVIERSAVGTDWLCRVSKSMIPKQEALGHLRTFLMDLARSFRGVYDGWETQIGEDEGGAD